MTNQLIAQDALAELEDVNGQLEELASPLVNENFDMEDDPFETRETWNEGEAMFSIRAKYPTSFLPALSSVSFDRK